MPFRQQEPVVPRMLHPPPPGLHQPLLETRERPALDPRRQDQSTNDWQAAYALFLGQIAYVLDE